jgi:hypothetical protein
MTDVAIKAVVATVNFMLIVGSFCICCGCCYFLVERESKFAMNVIRSQRTRKCWVDLGDSVVEGVDYCPDGPSS